MSYDAFISYSHAADRKLAAAVQSALHDFAKPWFQLRAVRTFRDKTSLAATPQLWSSIERALAESKYFVLLASPEAAASPWVQQEVRYWLQHKSVDTLLIGITGGTVRWNNASRDFDWNSTTALPDCLKGAFQGEPLYVDLTWAQHEEHLSLRDGRFSEAIAQLAAAVRNRPMDELAGEDVRQHRRNVITAWTAVSVLAALTVASLVGGYFAVQGRKEAEYQRNVATSELLASEAEGTARTRVGNAEEPALVALEASRKYPSVRANEALRGFVALLLRPYDGATRDGFDVPTVLSADRRVQAIMEPSGAIRVVESASGTQWARIERKQQGGGAPGVPNRPFLTEKGTFVLALEGDDQLSVWEARSGRKVAGHRAGTFALSADERHIAILSDDTLVLAPLVGAAGVSLAAGENLPDAFAFSPNGALFAIRLGTGETQVWSTETNKRLRSLTQKAGFGPLAFSPDGTRLATAGDDGIVVWRLADGSVAARIFGPMDSANKVAFHPGGAYIAVTYGERNWVAVWHLTSGREAFRAEHDTWVDGVAFSDDGRYLATVKAGDLRVWEWTENVEVARISQRNLGTAVRFFAQGARLVTEGNTTMPRMWSLRIPVIRRPLGPSTQYTRDAAFSPDGAWVAAGGGDGVVRVIELKTGSTLPAPPDHSSFCGSPDASHDVGVLFAPDGRHLATACGFAAYVWDTRTWALVSHFPDGQPVQRLAFSPDGHLLATGGNRGYASVFSVVDGTRVARIPVDEVALDIRFSADGRYLTVGSGGTTERGRAIVWSRQINRVVREIEHAGMVHSAALSADGRLALTGSSDGVAKLTDVEMGTTVATVRHQQNVEAVAFSPDGSRFATGSADGTARIWTVPDAGEVRELRHNASIGAIAFSPDGKYLATAGYDHQVRVWSIAAGNEVARERYDGSLTSVAFSPGDGSYIAAVGHYYKHPGSVWMWRTQDLQEEACRRLTRPLTQEEWSRYLPFDAYRLSCPRASQQTAAPGGYEGRPGAK